MINLSMMIKSIVIKIKTKINKLTMIKNKKITPQTNTP